MTPTRGAGRGVLALLTGSSAIQAAGGAVAALVATVLLGPSARGAMVLGLTVAGIATVVAGLGTGSSLRARLPAVSAGPARRGLIADYTWWSLAAMGLAAALAALGCALIAPAVDPVLARPGFLVGVALVTAAQTAVGQQTDAWFAAGLFRAGGGYAAAASVAGVVGLLLAAQVDRGGASGGAALLAGQGAASFVVTAVALGRLRRAGLAGFQRPTRAGTVGLVRHGVPVLGTTLGFVIAMRADRFVLGVFAGTAAVGIYSLAATLSEVPRMLPGSVGQLLLRDVAVAGRAAPVRRALRLALALTVAAGVVLGVGGWLLLPPVFGAEFAPARPALLVLLVAEVALVPYGLAIRGLVGGGWTGLAGGIGLVGAVSGLALFGVAVPLWTVMGAAGASLLLYLALSVVAWRIFRQRLAGTPAAADPVARPVAVAPS